MSLISEASNVFGYNMNDRLYEIFEDRCDRIIRNATNIAGYLPLLGIISLVARILYLRHDPHFMFKQDDIVVFKVVFIGRGIVEALGGGILFLILDIIISIKRHLDKANPPQHIYPK